MSAETHSTDARWATAVQYADAEINLLTGPFLAGPNDPDRTTPEQICGHAATIVAAWLNLSNPRAGGPRREKLKRELRMAYVGLALCKSLVKYPPTMTRRPAGVRTSFACVAPPPPLIDSALNADTYALSYTQNAAFREHFDNCVSALAAVKKSHDPHDHTADYRDGPDQYRRDVEACVGRFFPDPASLLKLIDAARDLPSSLSHRLIGAGCASAAEYGYLYARVMALGELAEELRVPGVPTPPGRGCGVERLWHYATEVGRAAEAAAVPTQPPAEFVTRQKAADASGLTLDQINRGVGKGIIAKTEEKRSHVDLRSVMDYSAGLRERQRLKRISEPGKNGNGTGHVDEVLGKYRCNDRRCEHVQKVPGRCEECGGETTYQTRGEKRK
jgi:hypothetical protein